MTTPPNPGDRPTAPRGTGDRPAAPPSSGDRPTTPPGTGDRTAAPSGTGVRTAQRPGVDRPAPPPPPSAFWRRWPGPAAPARPVVLGAVGAAALTAAAAVPLGRPGAGWLLAGVAATAALVTAATRPDAGAPVPLAHGGPPARPEPVRPADTTGPARAGEPTNPPAQVTPAGAPANPLAQATPAGEPTNPPAQATPAGEPTNPSAQATPAGEPTNPSAQATPAGEPTSPSARVTPVGDPTTRPGVTGAPGRVTRLAWAAATLALLGVGAVRDAGWLFGLCLLAAAFTGALAVAGGRTGLGMLTAVRISGLAPMRALPWARRSLARVGAGAAVGRSLVSVAVSVGLLLVFGLLFASADAVFADLVIGLLPESGPPDLVGWAFRLVLAVPVLLGGAYLLAAPPRLDDLRAKPGRPVRRREWVLPLALLDGLFAAFVLVQLAVLFGGSGHVLRTGGLTYAEYARGGFWQLLIVSALTLLVIGGAARWAPRSTRADRLLIRALLGTLTALSLVIVVSALYRMQVYTEAYGATRLRLFVAVTEAGLGLLFLFVGVAVARLRATWLPVLAVGTAVAALLALAVVNPDRLIAEWNVDRYQRTGRIDVGYLAGLSADAAPALDRLPEPQRTCALDDLRDRLVAEDDWRTANLGRAAARDLFLRHPLRNIDLDCPWPGRW
ncbi:DUF4173 domain-containing protein [Micromonospora sp. PLK6-60]|uniref:DUF4153 domain-containing protein n=1 Tax=Micromonospora sp. PLK6-60 TaxID=2873383 RepID=UPI001CA61B25|nr:DUF4173 domain-containing protein [Micromonospora sp. PLK6-60]MBY8873671.1 DUF4173 domain-containing protein [Micromonospora sp. PLK6-60]